MTKLTVLPYTSNNNSLPELRISQIYQQYVQKLLDATGQTDVSNVLPLAHQEAIQNFSIAIEYAVVSGIPSNLSNKIVCAYPLAGNTLTSALVNLIGAQAVNNGFVSGDYSSINGLTGDETSYFDIGGVPNTNLGMSLWISGQDTSARHDILPASWTATSVFGILIRNTLINIFNKRNSGNGYISVSGEFSTKNAYGANDDGSTVKGYQGATEIASVASGGSAPAGNLRAFKNSSVYGGLIICRDCNHSEFLYLQQAFIDLMQAMER